MLALYEASDIRPQKLYSCSVISAIRKNNPINILEKKESKNRKLIQSILSKGLWKEHGMPKSLKPFLLILSAVFLTDLSANIEIEPKPINMVEFTCDQFKDKSKDCGDYVCQTPYNLDPTIKTEWKIVGKNGNRCVISNTTSDMGLKDDNDNPKPITKTCEYNQVGIETLNTMMSDIQAGYFESLEDNMAGVYDCKFTSNGKPINDEPYVMHSDLD